MKKALTILAIVGLGWFVVKKTSFGETVKACWANIQKGEYIRESTTRDKIRDARAELTKMDQEVDRLVRPMAEYMAAIGKLKKDIAATETALTEQKEVLRILARDVSGGATSLIYSGRSFSADRVEAKLKKDFESYQRLENQLKSRKELLEAKEKALAGVQDQMAKAGAKKREFEVRLAQLEADEETLQLAKMGTKLQLDQTLTTQLEALLEDIGHRHDVDRAELELRTGKPAEDGIVVRTRPEAKTDAASILRYLEDGETTARK
ncbi:MAG: hypothetical protein U0793_23005 [Gemmataceae bacterium]